MTTQSPGPAQPGCDVPYTELLTGLRRFLRTEGRCYLDDPNITSIGLGDRVVGGRRTDELAVQFTVTEKRSEPEALAALGTTPVPETVTLAGTRVPTDVLVSSSRAAPTHPPTPVHGGRPGTADDTPVRAARGPAELPTR
jgi:hypothetical protein